MLIGKSFTPKKQERCSGSSLIQVCVNAQLIAEARGCYTRHLPHAVLSNLYKVPFTIGDGAILAFIWWSGSSRA